MSRERIPRCFDVAREDYTLFDMSQERITRFFDMSQEMYPCVSSGKKLRVNSRYPESFRFLGLWGRGVLLYGIACYCMVLNCIT